jgi:YidC/Oxa1 family membrane protein insertase
MGDDKRFILFLVLTMAIVVGTPMLSNLIWPPPPPKPPIAKKQDSGAKTAKQPAEASGVRQAETVKPDAGAKPAVEAAASTDEPAAESREIGSLDPNSGFRMKVRITNNGAAVSHIELSDPKFKSEDQKNQLQLIAAKASETGSFTLALLDGGDDLDRRRWRIVDTPDANNAADDAQSVTLQADVPQRGLVVTKTYRLRKDSYNLELAIAIRNQGGEPQQVAYRLGGPRGFALEGAWYSTKKRDAAIADGLNSQLGRHVVTAAQVVDGAEEVLELAGADGAITRDSWLLALPWFDRFDVNKDGRLFGDEVQQAAYRLAGGKDNRWEERPLRFAGVEGQFFAVLVVPPPLKNAEDRWDAATTPVLVERDRKHPDRSDVSIEIESRGFALPPGESLEHTYSIYAGPRKKSVLLAATGDPALAESIIGFSGVLLIFPATLVSLTANTMLFLLQLFHGWVHNWGVAIIMLTALVRLLMFPLSRKQALAAVKMQSLKPEMDAIREKYKADKQKQSQAQMELWRKHNVNPLGGCLPVLIQMPIFIGLWQGLQSSVDLRHARFFLWIDDLAAPDALFPFPWPEDTFLLSFLGPYFNLLPAVLIVLMLVQQKMFMPPKTDPPDPQMEMQQTMMTYMMVFFGFIFWRLPSGLCVYYIASTTWGIVERKLLPKLQHATPTLAAESEAKTSDADEAGVNGKGSKKSRKDKRPADHSKLSWLTELIKRAEKK